MAILDNSALVAPFAPLKDDGDSFIYTELLDRGKQKGNNSARLLKTFYHRSQEHFWERWPDIKELCDKNKIRAYTRLAKRSFEKTAQEHARMVLDALITKNHMGAKTLYSRALGKTPASEKIWIFDVDVINEGTTRFGQRIEDQDWLLARIPSKKGVHYISKPFDQRVIEEWYRELLLTSSEISLHKDNPTNLYIPDGAE